MNYKYASISTLGALLLLGGTATATAGDWSGLLSASVGSDDNVTLGDDSNVIASDESDSFVEVLGVAGRYLTGNKEDGVRFSGTLYNREYDTEDDFNFFLVGAGLAYHKRLSENWYGRFGAKYNYLEFGGDPYESIWNLTAEGRRKFSKTTELRLRYRYSDITSESSQFDNLEGDRHQLRVESRYKASGGNRYRVSYTFETNDRNDSSGPGTFTSSSPVRHKIRGNAKIPLATKWTAELDARYRNSRYKDDNVSGGTSTRRDDDRVKLKGELAYDLGNNLELFGNYIYTDNDSNIAVYDYERNEFNIGINYLFY